MEEFGINIKLLRENKGLSQNEMATIFSTTQATISRWEKNERQPDFETLKKLATFFETTTDNLIGHNKDKINYNNTEILEYKNGNTSFCHKKPHENKNITQQIEEIKKMLDKLIL